MPMVPVAGESLKHVELPKVPSPGEVGAALQFGDWMTIVYPQMCDVSTNARLWWDASLNEAVALYGRWLQAGPLQRLRMRPNVGVAPAYQRLEQRGITMLLTALPEQLRNDIVAARDVSVVSILYKLLTVFQPGGAAERTALLRSLTEVKLGAGVGEVLGAIRLWRRWLARADELQVVVPDPLVLMGVLGKMVDALVKCGGGSQLSPDCDVRQQGDLL